MPARFAVMALTEPELFLSPPRLAGTQLIGPGTLQARNPAWTDTAIKKFLGEPDKKITNPVVRRQGKMRLFLLDRAKAVEETEGWQEWVSAYTRRVANRTRTPAAPRSDLIGRGRTGNYPVTR